MYLIDNVNMSHILLICSYFWLPSSLLRSKNLYTLLTFCLRHSVCISARLLPIVHIPYTTDKNKTYTCKLHKYIRFILYSNEKLWKSEFFLEWFRILIRFDPCVWSIVPFLLEFNSCITKLYVNVLKCVFIYFLINGYF